MYNNSANEMLMGGGIPSAKFETPGTVISGPITATPEVQQQRDYATGELKFWDDGKPMQQIKVMLQTDQRDTADPYDDGQRAVYIKGNLLKAIRTAVRTAGATGLEAGGKLTITYTGDGEPSKRGFNPPKLFAAVYESPAAPGLVDANALLAGGQPAAPPAAPAVTAPPTPQPAAQPTAPPAATAGLSPEQAAAIAALSPEQRAALGL
jgi:hypothetical protein